MSNSKSTFTIIKIEGVAVWLADKSDNLKKVHIKRFAYEPQVNDEVRIVSGEGELMIVKVERAQESQHQNQNQNPGTANQAIEFAQAMHAMKEANKPDLPPNVRKVDKTLYVVACLFGLGYFVRGRIGMGILFLLTGGFLGIGAIVMLIQSFTKMSQYSDYDYYIFDRSGHWWL